jgi:hypothetical protein
MTIALKQAVNVCGQTAAPGDGGPDVQFMFCGMAVDKFGQHESDHAFRWNNETYRWPNTQPFETVELVTTASSFGPSRDEILHWFDNVVLDEGQGRDVQHIRDCFKATVVELLALIPSSADRTTAMRTLHAASTQAVFAYTHNIEEIIHAQQ